MAKKRRFAGGGDVYEVPGRPNYAASEALLKKRAAANPEKPDTRFDTLRRMAGQFGDMLEEGRYRRSEKPHYREEVEASISNRDDAYNKAMKDKSQSAEALKARKKTDPMSVKETEYKKGGVVKHRGDGLAQRGKTKGRFV